MEKARHVWAVQTDVAKITNKQLITILRPLRQKYDAPIPLRKDQLLNHYAEWTHSVTPYIIAFPNNAPPPPSATAPPPITTAPSPPSATAPPASATAPPPPLETDPPLPSATAPPGTAYNDTGSIFDDTDEEDKNNDNE